MIAVERPKKKSNALQRFRHGMAEPNWAFCITDKSLKEFLGGGVRPETLYKS